MSMVMTAAGFKCPRCADDYLADVLEMPYATRLWLRCRACRYEWWVEI